MTPEAYSLTQEVLAMFVERRRVFPVEVQVSLDDSVHGRNTQPTIISRSTNDVKWTCDRLLRIVALLDDPEHRALIDEGLKQLGIDSAAFDADARDLLAAAQSLGSAIGPKWQANGLTKAPLEDEEPLTQQELRDALTDCAGKLPVYKRLV